MERKQVCSMKKQFMQDMDWEEFQERLEEVGRTVVVPTGSTEQHGPYPLWVDCYNAIGPMKRVAELTEDVIFAPLLPITYSAYHQNYPGTISLSFDTCRRMLEEVFESLIKAGTERILVIVGHEGVERPLSEASRNLKRKYGTLFVSAACWQVINDAGLRDPSKTQVFEGHAGLLEGSITLACVSPELRVDLIKKCQERSFISKGNKLGGWGTNNITDVKWEGAIGGISAKLTTSRVGDKSISVKFPAGDFEEFTPPGFVSEDCGKHSVQHGQDIIEMTAQHIVKILKEIRNIPVPVKSSPIRWSDWQKMNKR